MENQTKRNNLNTLSLNLSDIKILAFELDETKNHVNALSEDYKHNFKTNNSFVKNSRV